MPVLFDEMNRLVVQSQVRSLGLALVLIFIMLLLSIRKLKAALIAMLPIVVTIFLINLIFGIINRAFLNPIVQTLEPFLKSHYGVLLAKLILFLLAIFFIIVIGAATRIIFIRKFFKN